MEVSCCAMMSLIRGWYNIMGALSVDRRLDRKVIGWRWCRDGREIKMKDGWWSVVWFSKETRPDDLSVLAWPAYWSVLSDQKSDWRAFWFNSRLSANILDTYVEYLIRHGFIPKTYSFLILVLRSCVQHASPPVTIFLLVSVSSLNGDAYTYASKRIPKEDKYDK